jgi:serine/threonine protein kinase/WD40 repeat protein
MEERTPAGKREDGDDFLARLTERVIAGEKVDPEPLCAVHPEHAATIREICARGAELAAAMANHDTVKMSSELRTGTFDDFLAALRAKIGPSRYVLRGSIATGGMGAILRVQDEVLQRPLAMKVILGQGAPNTTGDTPPVDDRTLGRFLDEAQVTAQLDHPGIVPVHELGVDAQGRVYFTMKLVKGVTFAEIIERVRSGDDGWTVTRAVQTLLRVAEAMAYAHDKRVLHRDLKPSNIMVGRFGEVYVMDWGLARVMGEPDRRDLRLREGAPPSTGTNITSPRRDVADDTPDAPLVTMDGDVVGTPAYMPPEQAAGRIEEVDARSDVYSFGAILYHLLAGHMPYVKPGDRVSARTILGMVLHGPPEPIDGLAWNAPPMLTAICQKAMARKARERYADMNALAADLSAYLEGRVVRAYRTGAVAEIAQWTRRNAAFAASIAVAILAVTAVTTYFVAALHRKNSHLDDINRNLQRATESITEAARKSEYLLNIRSAQSALHSLDFAAAEAKLAECAVELRGWEWYYLQSRANPTLHRIEIGDDAASMHVAWHPTGEKLVVSLGTRIVVFDAETGRQINERRLPAGAHVDQIAVDRRGQVIAVTAYDGLRALDFETLRTRWSRISDDQTGPFARSPIGFHPHADLLLAVADSPTELVALLNSNSGELINVGLMHSSTHGYIDAVALHPTRPLAALIGESSSLWDYSREKLIWREIPSESRGSTALFSLDANYLVVADDCDDAPELWIGSRYAQNLSNILSNEPQTEYDSLERAAQYWRREFLGEGPTCASNAHIATHDCFGNDKANWTLGSCALPYPVYFSPDGKRFAARCHDDHLHIATTRWLRAANFIDPGTLFNAISFDHNGHICTVTISGREDAFRRVHVETYPKQHRWSIDARDGEFLDAELSANGRRLIVRGQSWVDVYDTELESKLRRVSIAHGDMIDAAIDARGEYLAVCGRDWIRVYDVRDGSLLFQTSTDGLLLASISIGEHAALVAVSHDIEFDSSHEQMTLSTWNPRTRSWRTIRLPYTASGDSGAFSLSPDCTRIATGVNPLRVISSASGEELCTPLQLGHNRITWSEDGSRIIGYGWGTARILDAPLPNARTPLLRKPDLGRAQEIAWEAHAVDERPAVLAKRIRDDPRLLEHEKPFALGLWRLADSEYSHTWAESALDVSSSSNRTVEEYVEALDDAESAMDVALTGLEPHLALGAALFRNGRLSEAREQLHEEHFLTTRNYFDGESAWDVEDQVAALLALVEMKLGNTVEAKNWLSRGKIQLTEKSDLQTRRLVEEARAAVGVPVNPDGLPPIPDDED